MEKARSVQYKDVERLPRRWFPLPKLDGYILREFLIKYSVLLLVFVILFILSDVYRDISDFLEANASLSEIVSYLAYKLPGNIRFILPISMLLGCMWTMATFGKNMEITAMRASGVSLFRCGGSIFLVGLIVTGVNIYFNEALVPRTEQQAEIIREEAANKRRFSSSLLAFRSSDRKRHWLFSKLEEGGIRENVTLKTFWSDPMIREIVLTPEQGTVVQMVQKMFPNRYEQLLALPPDALEAKLFEELRGRKVDVYAARVDFNPETGRWRFNDGWFISYDRNDETRFEASRGTSIMHDEIPFSSIEFTDIPETPDDILNSIKEKDELPTWVIWDLVRRTPDMPDRVRSIYMTVFYYRLAFPWACFLAVFLGIPLATKNERTGSLMAIITAVGIIVIYIVVAQVFLVLGKGGILNPVFAGLAPTAGFILAGAARIFFDRN